MLVLTRRIGQEIIIGPDVTLTVVEIRDGKVRLAFTAPKEVPIWRQEIWEKIHPADGREDAAPRGA